MLERICRRTESLESRLKWFTGDRIPKSSYGPPKGLSSPPTPELKIIVSKVPR